MKNNVTVPVPLQQGEVGVACGNFGLSPPRPLAPHLYVAQGSSTYDSLYWSQWDGGLRNWCAVCTV